MNNALLMGSFERLGDLFRDRQRLRERQRGARDPLRKVLALDQFHDQGVSASGFLESVNRRDVRMIERRERFRFAFEPRQAARVGGKRTWENLDGDLAAQRRVRRSVHLPHPAFTDQRDDLVGAEAGTLSEDHGWRNYTGAGDAPTGLLVIEAGLQLWVLGFWVLGGFLDFRIG